MSMPNLTTATAAEIIDYELKRAMRHEQCDRCARQEYLVFRMQMIIGMLVDQRDLITLTPQKEKP